MRYSMPARPVLGKIHEGGGCSSCHTWRQVELVSEICMHVPGGLQALEKPPLWLFPKVVVCLHCGLAQFAVPTSDLIRLQRQR